MNRNYNPVYTGPLPMGYALVEDLPMTKSEQRATMLPPGTSKQETVTMTPQAGGSSTTEKKQILLNITKKKKTVRLKEKRVRENRRLQKVLIPKHALMAIHEIKGVVMSEFDVTGQTSGGLFKASVTVNGTAYDGEGMSKIAAKNAACEKALRDLMLQKLQKKFIQSSLSGSTASMDVDEGDKPSQEDDEDDVPMMTLMSYALHKLFSEWESQGYTIPENKQASPGGDMLLPTIPTRSADSPPPVPPPSAPNLPLPKSELPKNAGTYHPVMLMSIMKPGLKFTDLGCIGTTPNTMYTVSVTIEHVIFLGKGRSKKLAKKAAAKDAMETIYGVKFVDADSMTQ